MSEIKILGKSDLIAVEDRRYENIHVPEWGGYIRVRSLSAAEGLELIKALGEERQRGMILCLLMSAVDANDELLFDGDVDTEFEMLEGKALSGFSLVQDVVLEMNRLGARVGSPQPIEEAKND